MGADPFINETELKSFMSKAGKVFVLVDENTRRYCLPHFERLFGVSHVVLETDSGESCKTLNRAEALWKSLFQYEADCHSLLINLGGGMICDLGGFVASCYKRGIATVNVPTTLLAMVDAAIGGKTAVDFWGVKNQIGTFHFPQGVFLCDEFLDTLPRRELLSGWAEMIKYGYVAYPELLHADFDAYKRHILQAAEIKHGIVAKDPYEEGLRKILNFGHTIGHAVESRFLQADRPLLHGEAVAMGMYAALWLSVQYCGLSREILDDYGRFFQRYFSHAFRSISEEDMNAMVALTSSDKKNRSGAVRFVLLKALAQPVVDVEVPPKEIKSALLELQKIMRI